MRLFILALGLSAFLGAYAQIDDGGFGGRFGSTTDTFGDDETYYEFGPNYSFSTAK